MNCHANVIGGRDVMSAHGAYKWGSNLMTNGIVTIKLVCGAFRSQGIL